ncbi:protein of unknown function [Agreia sp. COWG]|nr:protein of unknown function [Agreia sp. COWG]
MFTKQRQDLADVSSHIFHFTQSSIAVVILVVRVVPSV